MQHLLSTTPADGNARFVDVSYMTSTPFGDYAESYANRGFPVLAVVAGTLDPIGGEVRGTTDVDEIRAINEHFPAANVGITTDDLVVLELQGDAAFDALRRYGPFEGPISAIGDTRHVYFALRGGLPSGPTALPGVRIRSRGDYVLAPPSWLFSVGPSRWLRSPWDSWLMPIAPAWLIKLSTAPPADVLRVAEASFSAGGSHVG